MSTPASPLLSPSQLAALAEIGEERRASVGERLYGVGDRIYPFIALLEGEVAIIDAAGNELVRHGPSGFLGELNLLSGQTVFVNALVAEPLRYIAVERGALRSLLNEDGPLGDLLLSAFISRREALQSVEGIGVEIVGPRDSESTMRILDFARANRLPYTWQETAPPGGGTLPLVRLPGGGELHGPSTGQVLRALGIGLELAPREEVDLLIIGAGPAGLAAAVYGASEGLDTLVVEGTALGGQAGSSRRIENYLGFPAGISGTELTSRAVTQARKFNARTATPYRALSLEPGNGRHLVRLEDDREIAARAVLLATGAQYRRLPVDRLAEFEGLTIFYAAGAPEAQLCAGSRVAIVGGGNSAGQAAVWLARGGALATVLHRRADLAETMSDYLIHELERYGVAVRDRSEVAALHGEDGRLAAVTLTSGERLPFSFMFLFLGASPCTEWLDCIARDQDGFILTGPAANADNLLETDIPGVFAAGDVRSGSSKRCATAVGEGAMAVQFVHAHLSPHPSRRDGEVTDGSPGAMTADGRTRVLADGNRIPLLGLGVWEVPNGAECANAVRWALELGYRHIDTAQAYGNEESVGQGLRESGVPRDEIFVTTKFNPRSGDPVAAARLSLERLGLDHVDLYLIHWPEGGPTWAWPGMERARELGYARSIGVSNFDGGDLQQLLATATVAPAVDQVQFSPYEHRKALLDQCEEHGIVLEAYSPLGRGRHLGSEVAARIAQRLGRTPAQVLLRWCIERRIPVIPKSSHRERIAENAQLFDFTLTDEDLAQLDQLDRTGGTDRALEHKWWSQR